MYRYDEFDHQLLAERIAQFGSQVERRLAGELSEDQFKPLRLMNGLYLQLHAYMLRVNVPYGVLSATQLRGLAEIARRFDRGYGHFTTRQNIQFNWISLTDVPAILRALAGVEMNSIQSSGNCVRNITADHFAGRAADEIEDPRIWCELIRQYSLLHPEFSYLPRKFKIAVTGAPGDRAAVAVHDIGLRLHRDARGEAGFEVLVGGGQGRTPHIGQTLNPWVATRDILGYIEAILRVYNLYGRRDNIYKARIKILVNALGLERFGELVAAEWAVLRDGELTVPAAEAARIRAHFAPPPWLPPADDGQQLARQRAADPAFDAWLQANTAAHRAPGYAIVSLSLKAPGCAPGDLDAERMDAVAALSEGYGFGEIRVSHRQNLVLPDVRHDQLHELWQALCELDLATPNTGLLTDIIACPGLDYCSLANARSLPVAGDLGRAFADPAALRDIGPLSLNISGCMNACGHHHVGNIGILGVDKQGEEFFQLTLGGAADGSAAIGERLGRALPQAEVPGAVAAIVDAYRALRRQGEPFVDTVRRVGTGPFRTAVYDTGGKPRRVA